MKIIYFSWPDVMVNDLSSSWLATLTLVQPWHTIKSTKKNCLAQHDHAANPSACQKWVQQQLFNVTFYPRGHLHVLALIASKRKRDLPEKAGVVAVNTTTNAITFLCREHKGGITSMVLLYSLPERLRERKESEQVERKKKKEQRMNG